MNKMYEKCLMLRDSKTKKYVKQIKLDDDLVSVKDLQSYFMNVQDLINRIDNKYMTIIKSSLVYQFQGLIDSSKGDHTNIDDVKHIKRDLQSSLNTFIDAILIDLATQCCNPVDIRKGIDVVNYIYYCINILQGNVLGGTESQNLTIEEKIIYLNNSFNKYIEDLINGYDYQKNCLRFTIPIDLFHAWQISRAITETDCNIDELKRLRIVDINVQPIDTIYTYPSKEPLLPSGNRMI